MLVSGTRLRSRASLEQAPYFLPVQLVELVAHDFLFRRKLDARLERLLEQREAVENLEEFI